MYRTYLFTSPQGRKYVIHNVHHFCMANADLFTSEQIAYNPKARTCQAAIGLARLAPWRKQPSRQWRGWRWSDETSKP
jgi:hypothetical protein